MTLRLVDTPNESPAAPGQPATNTEQPRLIDTEEAAPQVRSDVTVIAELPTPQPELVRPTLFSLETSEDAHKASEDVYNARVARLQILVDRIPIDLKVGEKKIAHQLKSEWSGLRQRAKLSLKEAWDLYKKDLETAKTMHQEKTRQNHLSLALSKLKTVHDRHINYLDQFLAKLPTLPS